ncbi:MAG TPA: cation:proton antiporter [Candidatus Baltobacteraceae bacterium]|nr:cation:proton antiporter [Candidatus Baltobacteraceae bacterium]
MKLQYIVVLVLAGIGYGMIEPGRLTYAFGHATLYVLLPALLFEAAWNLRYRAMLRGWRAIAILAVPGVLLTAVLIAGALAVVHVPFKTGLLAGAILSATDPIAVVGIFRRMRVPALLSTIVECESLFNDAVAVALYRAVLAAVLAGSVGAAGLAQISATAIAGVIGGIAIGIGIAFVAAALLRNRNDVVLQILATGLCAYVSYYAADRLDCSGIFATIAGGIAIRSFERRWISLTVAEDVNRFWDVAALVANALVFFLVGAALDVSIVTLDPAFVLAALAGVMIARVAVSGLLLPTGYPREWLDVVRVAGMRGALSLALAIALPQVPQREAIIAATFAVALATIISSTLTVPPVVARVAARRPNG